MTQDMFSPRVQYDVLFSRVEKAKEALKLTRAELAGAIHDGTAIPPWGILAEDTDKIESASNC